MLSEFEFTEEMREIVTTRIGKELAGKDVTEKFMNLFIALTKMAGYAQSLMMIGDQSGAIAMQAINLISVEAKRLDDEPTAWTYMRKIETPEGS